MTDEDLSLDGLSSRSVEEILKVAEAALERAQADMAAIALELLTDAVIDGDTVRIDREAFEELQAVAKEWQEASEVFRRLVSATVPK